MSTTAGRWHRPLIALPLLAVALECTAAGEPRRPRRPPADLTEMSLDELANLEVTSVSKKEQKLSEAAAAIFVITQEDIRRSGLTTIPELLRMAPGVDVARIDGADWAISARGFNDKYANQLLVLVDGRTVYTPLFSGVYWELQDLPPEDIERIEVIRGPGAAVWGANAVNGVINIITKEAKNTQGGLLTAGGGDKEGGFGTVQYGGTLGGKGYYRAFAKYFDQQPYWGPKGVGPADRRDLLHGGFRTDWQLSRRDGLTVQGDLYTGGVDGRLVVTSLTPPYNSGTYGRSERRGGNLLGRWTRTLSDGSDLSLQFYYDAYHRQNYRQLLEKRQTFDLEFQHRFRPSERHEIGWGLGARYSGDDVEGSFFVAFNPPRFRDRLFTVFAQDEIALVPERLHLTIGSRFEHNDFSGFEGEPNIRLLWSPDPQQSLWGAVSRAVQTPARNDRGLVLNPVVFVAPDGLPAVAFALRGAPSARTQTLLAYEIGYRRQISPRLSVDVASFYNVYDNLRTYKPGAPYVDSDPARHGVLPLYFGNRMHGHTFGMDAVARWNMTGRWRLNGSYSWLAMRLHPDPATIAGATAGQNPQHQFNAHSYIDLPWRVQFDTSLYFVAALPTPQIPSHYRLDTRFARRFGEQGELSFGAQDLLSSRHPEFLPTGATQLFEVGRSLYGKVTWRF